MLERIARVEFFAILPPGFYVLLAGMVAFASNDVKWANATLWARLEPSAIQVGHEPALALLVLFGSYLAGMLLRTIPLKLVERCLPPFRVIFPHGAELRAFLDKLLLNPEQTRADLSDAPDLGKPLSMEVYNHWKNALCIKSPDGYRSYQGFESRSRMFAGMFWSGLLGVASAIVGFARADGVPPPFVWQTFGISSLVVLLFGAQFRRVRTQEAIVLLSLFIWCGKQKP